MDQKFIHTYLKTKYMPEEGREALYRAASVAQDLGWTFMEVSFQLGEKAHKDDGLDKEQVEATLRRAFARDRRVKERRPDQAESPMESASPRNLELDAESRELLVSRRIDPDALAIPWPTDDWRKDLLKLLEVAFAPEETIEFKVTDTPKSQRETVANVLSQSENINKIMRSLDGPEGALMGINPVACEGAKDDAWRFRFVVVDSPRMSLAKQLAYYKALNLPCVALVNSGANSVQAWVKVEAVDSNEYTDRVDFLYHILEDNGFKVDSANKSPAMMVRMPGVLRQGKQQYLIGLNQGARTWKEWQEWVEHNLDGNPLVELASNHQQKPSPDPEIIEGALRAGQFLVVTAPPKAGKSMALIDLALSLCHGGDWLGFPTHRTDVLYINFELTKAAFINRLHLVASQRNMDAATPHLGFLNLRGTAMPPLEMARFIAKRIVGARKYEDRNYQVVIVDPLASMLSDNQVGSISESSAVLLQVIDIVAALSGAAVVGAMNPGELDAVRLRSDSHLDLSPVEERPNAFQIRGNFRDFPSLIARECFWRYPLFHG